MAVTACKDGKKPLECQQQARKTAVSHNDFDSGYVNKLVELPEKGISSYSQPR